MAEFTSMLWIIILHGYKSLTHKLHSRWDSMMLQYAVIAGMIQFALHLVQIPDFAIGKGLPPTHTITEPPPCFTVGVIQGGCRSFPNFSQHIDPLIWHKDFKLWFVSLKEFIPLLYWSSLCAPRPIGAFWNCFAFSKVVSWQQFSHIDQFHIVFFS